MSIATKGGDGGTTALMYGQRVPKNHPRVEACGAVDELNAALGLVRATNASSQLKEQIKLVQQNLILLMGELATPLDQLPRYHRDGYKVLTPDLTVPLDQAIKELESQKISFAGWATPGANLAAASLDLARTACRRAERRVCDLQEQRELQNPELLVYLNRLSDLLWLWARKAETE